MPWGERGREREREREKDNDLGTQYNLVSTLLIELGKWRLLKITSWQSQLRHGMTCRKLSGSIITDVCINSRALLTSSSITTPVSTEHYTCTWT